MKRASFIFPLVILVAGGGWITSQFLSLAAAERANGSLRKEIETARARVTADSSRPADSTQEAPVIQIGDESHPPDWKTIIGQLAGIGMGQPYNLTVLTKQLEAMTAGELFGALDEIDALGASIKDKNRLIALIVKPLLQKDTAAGLTRFIGRLEDTDSGFTNEFSAAFKQWVAKDPASAKAWFDHQIAGGNFDSRSVDGRSRPRVEFEEPLMHAMLASNGDEVAQRLAAMPPGQRADVMQAFHIAELNEPELKNYVAVVRGQLTPEDSNRIIAQATTYVLCNSDYAAAARLLDQMGATAEERAATVAEAPDRRIQFQGISRKVERQDFEAMRSWIASQSPDAQVEAMTGKAVAAAIERKSLPFPEAVALVLAYREQSGSDEGLAAFLESRTAKSRQKDVMPLLEKISDPKLRAKILTGLVPQNH